VYAASGSLTERGYGSKDPFHKKSRRHAHRFRRIGRRRTAGKDRQLAFAPRIRLGKSSLAALVPLSLVKTSPGALRRPRLWTVGLEGGESHARRPCRRPRGRGGCSPAGTISAAGHIAGRRGRDRVRAASPGAGFAPNPGRRVRTRMVPGRREDRDAGKRSRLRPSSCIAVSTPASP
jgi:hypothetical protein